MENSPLGTPFSRKFRCVFVCRKCASSILRGGKPFFEPFWSFLGGGTDTGFRRTDPVSGPDTGYRIYPVSGGPDIRFAQTGSPHYAYVFSPVVAFHCYHNIITSSFNFISSDDRSPTSFSHFTMQTTAARHAKTCRPRPERPCWVRAPGFVGGSSGIHSLVLSLLDTEMWHSSGFCSPFCGIHIPVSSALDSEIWYLSGFCSLFYVL